MFDVNKIRPDKLMIKLIKLALTITCTFHPPVMTGQPTLTLHSRLSSEN